MADMTIRECVEALRPVALQARSAVRLAEALESLGSVENHRDELTAQVASLKLDVEQACARRSEAEAQSVRVCAEAKEKAEQVVASAQAQADDLLASADANVVQAVALKEAELADLQHACTEAETARHLLQEEIDSLTTHRDALAEQIAELRAKVANL